MRATRRHEIRGSDRVRSINRAARSLPLLLALAVAFTGALLAAGPLGAAEWTVNSTLDQLDANPGNGQCATIGGACTLRAAIQEANATSGADRVVVPAGTYTLTRAGVGEDECETGDLDIFDDLELAGAGSGLTIIDADGIDRVLHLNNFLNVYPAPRVTVTGVTLTGGNATTALGYLGGGAFAEGVTTASFDDVRFVANSANQGGGLQVLGGMLIMDRCSVLDNELIDVAITNRQGEGIYVSSATVGIGATTVAGNHGALLGSGALYVHGSTWATIVDSTITGNAATGIRGYNSYLEVIRCTLANNGGQGLSFGSYDGTDTLTLAASILAGNSGGSCSVTSGVYVHSHNIDSGDTCSLSPGAGELINTDPQLGPLAANGGLTQSLLPQPGSPAIDMVPAADTYCQGHDQRGALRPTDDDSDGQLACEAGSVEIGLLLADGFESGDTTRWSGSAP